ncbi:MAG: DUF6377 domain-containing protein [Bacteroides sp.]|nr:DUF6377 domain-containing protein [Bacteroides sp.]
MRRILTWKRYMPEGRDYNDSILVYLDETIPLYGYHTCKRYYMEGRYEEAFEPIQNYLACIDTLSNEAARAYYQLSLLYKQKGDRENEERELIRSVIADEHSAVRQNRSLRLLAQLLYEQGDIKRAYRYIQVSSVDANFYNTRLRNSQVAEALPIIERDYQLERDRQERRLRIGILLISVLFVIILLFALYIRRKRRQLSVARRELIRQNEDLNQMNEEMREKNEELFRLADELQESDQIKEKYVGYFLQLCSVYIQKIGEYRKTVNRKIRTGQIDDLYRMTASTQALQTETKEFYKKFDEAFLHIFPNFVADFNNLLREDQRFDLKKEELLNTELRIFALIRLGIKDSSQIAEFLSYNPVTIYSYRTKVKSKAINKGSFDKNIMEIRRKV